MTFQSNIIRIVPPLILLPFEKPVSKDKAMPMLRCITKRWFLKDTLRTCIHGFQADLLCSLRILHPEWDQPPGEQLDVLRVFIRYHWEFREVKAGGMILFFERH